MQTRLCPLFQAVVTVLITWLLAGHCCWATTGGDAVISPENQRQLIADWGYDIKEGGRAAGLTPSLAQSIFVTDAMTCLRLPVYGDSVNPAHPGAGVVIASYYADVLTAITNARAARSNIVLFASKKLQGQTSFPAWVKDANGIIPSQYALMLADYLQFMQTNGVIIDVLGIDNEMQYNEGDITPDKYTQTIDALKLLAASRGFAMPRRLIGPEDYNPDANWVSTLVASGWGDRLDIAGTHYYPGSRPLTSLQNFFRAAGGPPAWHSEVHWDSGASVITQGELALAAVFDCVDTGLSGFSWWAYTRSGVQGGLERALTISTLNSRPIDIDDADGTATTPGTLITRAFRQGTNIFVWALNNTTSNRDAYGFKLDIGSIAGTVGYQQWNTNAATTGSASLSASNLFRLTLPPGTITEFIFNYRPPTPGPGDSDGDGLSDNFENSNGFDTLTPNIVFLWTGSASGGDGDSLYQEANWSSLGSTGAALTINQNTPVTHDLLSTNGGLGGGAGFGASLNLGWRTFSIQGGYLRAQASAGITGAAAGRLRIGGRSQVWTKFLDTIRTETTGAPQITFYTINAFSNGATLNILGSSSPKIIVQNTTPQAVQATFLPSLYIAGKPADMSNVQLSVVNTTDVQILRLGDSDGDGASDIWEWANGFDPSNPSDGALDPDHDGVPNWLESRLGTSPIVPSAGLFLDAPRVSSNHTVVLRFGPGGTKVLYSLWWTSAIGQPWAILKTVNGGASPAAFYEVAHTNLNPAGYYRLEASPGP